MDDRKELVMSGNDGQDKRLTEWLEKHEARMHWTIKARADIEVTCWHIGEALCIVLRYLDRDDDKWQYGSTRFDYMGIDEAAEFPQEDTYTFMFSRLRREEGSAIPSRMRLGANPIGPGAAWIKRRFICIMGICPMPAQSEK